MTLAAAAVRVRVGRIRLGLVVIAILAFAIAVTSVDLKDFDVFYQAGVALRVGQSPYADRLFMSPVYVLLYFGPLSILPLPVAYRLHVLVSTAALVWSMWKLSNRQTWAVFLFLLTPWVIFSAWYGNIDWLVLLGATLNPLLGIWLVMLKPQIGLVLAGLMLLEIARERSWLLALAVGVAVAAVFGLSLAVGMRWGFAVTTVWNASAWPYGLIAAVPLGIYALRRKNRSAALAAGPFLSPYLSPGSWMAVFPFLTLSKKATVAFIILSWLLLLAWRTRI